MNNINILLNGEIPVKIRPELKHLSPLEIQNLVWDYLNYKILLKDIMVNYDLSVNQKRLSEILPPQVLEKKCPACGHPMVRALPTRTQMKNINSRDEDYGYGYVEKPAYCPNCDHTEAPGCECHICVEKRNKENAKKDKIIAKNKKTIQEYNEMIPKIPYKIQDLNYKDKIYLITLIRFAVTRDMKRIGPLDKVEKVYNCLALGDMEHEIINYLFHKHLIKVNLNSPDEAFCCEKEVFNFRLVSFDLNVEYEENQSDLVNKLSDFEIDVSDEGLLDELEELWRKTAEEHCLRFFKRQMEYCYKTEEIIIGKKVKFVIEDLLNSHSIYQIYSKILNSIKLKKRNLGHKELNYKDFENEVTSIIWNVNFDNDAEYKLKDEINPKPIFTNLLFGKLLKINSKGYSTPPDKKIIKESNL